MELHQLKNSYQADCYKKRTLQSENKLEQQVRYVLDWRTCSWGHPQSLKRLHESYGIWYRPSKFVAVK